MPQNPTDPNWGTPNPTDPNWGQQAAPSNPSATGWRHAADTAISDITSLPRLALSAIQDPGGTASHLGQSAVDLYQKANDFVADPVTSAKQGLSAIKADPWAAAGHVGAIVAQGGALAGLKRLGGTLSPIEAAIPAEAAAAARPVRGLLGPGAIQLPPSTDFDASFARGVPAQFAEREPMAAAPVAEAPAVPRWVHQPEDKRSLFAAAQKAADEARGQPAAPMAASIPGKSPQMIRNEEGLAARQAAYKASLQPKDPAAELAKMPGVMSDAQVADEQNARWGRGEVKTPSAGLAQKMKGQQGSVPIGPLLQSAGIPARILAYPAAYHYAGTPGLATLGAADLAKLIIEHPEMAGKAGRAALLANMAVTTDQAR